MTEAQRAELRLHHVPVYDAPIGRIESDGEGMVQQVLLQDGTAVACSGIFFKPRLAAGSELLQALGCKVTEEGAVAVDLLGKMNVPGIYSAGDAATQFHQAITAAASGSLAAAGINNELNKEAWQSSTR
jgi:thioredoxin reductase